MKRATAVAGPPIHLDTEIPDRTMDLDGLPLRRYGPTWCSQTAGGNWREVVWMRGKVVAHQALDALYTERTR